MGGPVEPKELLKGLDSLLGIDGNVKDTDSVDKVFSLMKTSNKLVSRCIYMNIIKATKATEVLEKFIELGGWDLMNDWLKEAKEDSDTPILLEIMKVYQVLPVTVELLRKNTCAKTIKQISKSDDEKLKHIASELVDNWMQKVRGEKGDTPSSDKKQKKKKSHSHKEESNVDTKLPSNSDKDSNIKHSSKSNSQEKTEHKKPSNNTEEKIESSKPRARTVKTLPSKFRSTGLETDTQLPPAKKKSTISSKPDKSVKRPGSSNLTLKPGPPPEKRQRPTVNTNMFTTNHNTSATSPTEKHGKIKLIAARPQPIHESSGFMDALTSTPSAPLRKKKKVPTATLR